MLDYLGGSKCNLTCILNERQRNIRHTRRRRQCEDRSRDWSDTAINQGMPRGIRN